MGKKIVDAEKDSRGNISAVRFQGNSTSTPVETAIKMADKGQIDNAHAVHPKNGKSYLRSNQNSRATDNLDSLAGD